MQREIRAILSYSSQEHKPIFQKHFHNTIERKFLDTDWLIELIGDLDRHSQALKFVKNLESTITKAGNGRTEIVFTYECNNHYANKEFEYFVDFEIDGHPNRIEIWLDDWNIYMVDMGYPITEDELHKLWDIFIKKAFSYKYEIKT